MELYLHSPIWLHGVVFRQVQQQTYTFANIFSGLDYRRQLAYKNPYKIRISQPESFEGNCEF